MTRETIKEYILQVKSQDGTESLYNKWEPNILVEVINQIFDDHEALQQPKNCDGCRSKSCSVKRILLELGEINSSYFYCNDYEPKEQ